MGNLQPSSSQPHASSLAPAEQDSNWTLRWSAPPRSTKETPSGASRFSSLCAEILAGADAELRLPGQVIDPREEEQSFNQFRMVGSATAEQRDAIEREMLGDRFLDRAIGAVVGMQVSFLNRTHAGAGVL